MGKEVIEPVLLGMNGLGLLVAMTCIVACICCVGIAIRYRDEKVLAVDDRELLASHVRAVIRDTGLGDYKAVTRRMKLLEEMTKEKEE